MRYDMPYNNDETETRKADNRIIENRQKINEVDNQIDDEKGRLEKLSTMQETIDSIAKNVDKCIELLSKSMKGPNTDSLFNDMYNSNKAFFKKASSNIESEETNSRKKINELYKEKEKILKDTKDYANEEKNKEENNETNQEE